MLSRRTLITHNSQLKKASDERMDIRLYEGQSMRWLTSTHVATESMTLPNNPTHNLQFITHN